MMADEAISSIEKSGQVDVSREGGQDLYLDRRGELGFLFVIVLVSIFCQIDRSLPFILSESIKADLLLTDTQLGLNTGLAFAICHTLFSLPIARVADRGSPRLVLVACILVWSAMTGLGGLATGFAFLAISRLGVAVGEAGAIPAGHALIARRIRPERRGLAIGLFSMGIPLGTMVGFAAGGAIADTLGWRAALAGAGAVGAVLAILVAAMKPTSPLSGRGAEAVPFLQVSLKLLSSPAFRWLIVGAIAVGFASAPFYAFAAPFLIRTHGFSASQAGLAFGLLQGGMGLVGTLVGGRGFDRRLRAGGGRLLTPQAILFLVASVTTGAALFVPIGWLSIALFVPGMFSFAFMLPAAFGAAHLVAGPGNQAMASSLVMIGSGLFGPTLAPLFVGMVSDAAGAAQISNGLGLGLLIVPFASVFAAIAMLVAGRRIPDVMLST